MNPLMQLVTRYQKGRNPVFLSGPFLPISLINEKGLSFNRLIQHAGEMSEAALLNLDFGFENIVLPYDMNLEAEMIGCDIRFHEDMEGVPIYPTIGERFIQTADDFDLPEDPTTAGRMPVMIETIRTIKEKANGRACVGVFIPGPFTLAGQVLDPDKMFVMVLKKPDVMQAILHKLTDLIFQVRSAYLSAGVDFIIIEEGGAANISPKSFKSLLMDQLKRIFEEKAVPHILSITGKSERYVDFMLEIGSDAIGVDQESDIDEILKALPKDIPLMAVCGAYDMLAVATPEEVRAEVRSYLDRGVALVSLPPDIYPPAKLENIEAFVDALKK